MLWLSLYLRHIILPDTIMRYIYVIVILLDRLRKYSDYDKVFFSRFQAQTILRGYSFHRVSHVSLYKMHCEWNFIEYSSGITKIVGENDWPLNQMRKIMSIKHSRQIFNLQLSFEWLMGKTNIWVNSFTKLKNEKLNTSKNQWETNLKIIIIKINCQISLKHLS